MLDFRSDAEKHARDCGSMESCGIVVDGVYWRCRNIADNPFADFVIDPKDYVVASLHGEIQAIVHSHPNGGPASEADKAACVATKLPWHIWSVPEQKWSTINP